MSLSIVSSWALVGVGVLVFGTWVVFALYSLAEREQRAALLAFLLAIAGSVPLFLLVGAPAATRGWVLGVLALVGGAMALSGFLPIGVSHASGGQPSRRVDERDVMFARARLKPDSREFREYYALRPQHRESDDRTRALPGLLSPDAPKADPLAFASARAAFRLTSALRHEVNGPVTSRPVETPAVEIAAAIERQLLALGARDVGFTELRPYHVYSHVGRGTGTWGDEIRLDHRWAIAFTVEMDHTAMQCAPDAPVLAESARQYVESAKIAIQLATMIRSFGYPARAHIDGNYQVIAPLVARDAGLGEIGRIGILMTPGLGPRVRLGVVTTDLPLVPSEPASHMDVIDFCTVCKKCADNCPSESIPFGDREPVDSGLRWAIDPDGCFRYWNAIGTDCGRCMAVCPYSHPDNLPHNLVRWAVQRSGAARRAGLWMDDFLYGRRMKNSAR